MINMSGTNQYRGHQSQRLTTRPRPTRSAMSRHHGVGWHRIMGLVRAHAAVVAERRRARPAIAFSNTIKTSTNLEKWWPELVGRQAADVGRSQDLGKTLLDLDVKHIDGKTRASARAQAFNELRAEIPEGRCRIVTNAKCLTEGVDVSALDAVLFMQPRKSKVEIVQAVGRVMRTAPGKKRGYIVLPVIVPEGKRVTDSDFLRSSEFQPVWDVIAALRAHDERMDVWVMSWDREPARPFAAPVTDTTPDLELVSKGQAFPRYRYKTDSADTTGLLDLDDHPTGAQNRPRPDGRVGNITDWCLHEFQQHYNDPSITKDDIWAYIYGVLHAQDWRTRYAHDLRKGLPRIPLAPDF